MTSAHELGLLRLVAQRVAGPGFATAAEAVRWLTAVQAQEFPGAILTVALRTRERTRTGVFEALNAGTVIRAWPMRGTLHFVAAEDLAWILQLTQPRMLIMAEAMRSSLGLDAAVRHEAQRVAERELGGGRQASRAELLEFWQRAGVSTEGQRGYHLIGYLAQLGVLCFGPVVDGEQRLVLLAEWVPQPRRLEREEALGELALRYFRSHGPATVKDFSGWTKLLAADIRIGVAIARPELERAELDGVEYLMDPRTPARLSRYRTQARAQFLLPGFDEFLLGYSGRDAVLPAEFRDLISPGGNGIFRPTVVSAGQVIGTWRRSPPASARARGGRSSTTFTPFTQFSPEVETAITSLAEALP